MLPSAAGTVISRSRLPRVRWAAAAASSAGTPSPVIADTKVMPQTIEQSYEALKGAF